MKTAISGDWGRWTKGRQLLVCFKQTKNALNQHITKEGTSHSKKIV